MTNAERNQRQRAAVQHGLYVRAAGNLKARHYRAGRLLGRLRLAMGAHWLEDTDLPHARAWCEMEVLAADAYALIQRDGLLNQAGDVRKVAEFYLRLRTAQAPLTRELGLTPAARLSMNRDAHGIRAATAAERAAAELRARYGPKPT